MPTDHVPRPAKRTVSPRNTLVPATRARAVPCWSHLVTKSVRCTDAARVEFGGHQTIGHPAGLERPGSERRSGAARVAAARAPRHGSVVITVPEGPREHDDRQRLLEQLRHRSGQGSLTDDE